MVIAGIGSFVIDFFNIDNLNKTIDSYSSEDETLVEDVIIDGYSCFNLQCSVSIGELDYILSIDNSELFTILGDYDEYIKLNIYYVQDGDDKYITNYELFIRSTSEDISGITTENELRDMIGLYSLGTHTDSFILKEIGTTGIGFEDDVTYTYIDYIFVDDNDVEYEMKYVNPDDSLDLIEGNTYVVTFEVVEGMFDYEFNIKTIE